MTTRSHSSTRRGNSRRASPQIKVTTRVGVRAILQSLADAAGVSMQVLASQLLRAHCGRPHLAPTQVADEVLVALPSPLPSEETEVETWNLRLTPAEIGWLDEAPHCEGDGRFARGKLVYLLTRAAAQYDRALLEQLWAGDFVPRRGGRLDGARPDS